MSAPAAETTGNGGPLWHGVYSQVKTLHFAARQGQTYEPLEAATTSWLSGRRVDELLERNRARYLQTRPEGTGWLADAPAAINDQIEWSEVYTPSRRCPYLTVSRAWAHANNSAPDFLWDSFFNALLASQEDRGRSCSMLREVTSWQNDQGMFAQYGEWRPQMTPSIFPVAWGHFVPYCSAGNRFRPGMVGDCLMDLGSKRSAGARGNGRALCFGWRQVQCWGRSLALSASKFMAHCWRGS